MWRAVQDDRTKLLHREVEGRERTFNGITRLGAQIWMDGVDVSEAIKSLDLAIVSDITGIPARLLEGYNDDPTGYEGCVRSHPYGVDIDAVFDRRVPKYRTK